MELLVADAWLLRQQRKGFEHDSPSLKIAARTIPYPAARVQGCGTSYPAAKAYCIIASSPQHVLRQDRPVCNRCVLFYPLQLRGGMKQSRDVRVSQQVLEQGLARSGDSVRTEEPEVMVLERAQQPVAVKHRAEGRPHQHA